MTVTTRALLMHYQTFHGLAATAYSHPRGHETLKKTKFGAEDLVAGLRHARMRMMPMRNIGLPGQLSQRRFNPQSKHCGVC